MPLFGVIETKPGQGTFYIALSFIFIAYLLHPKIESAFHRIRAYHAWLKIENGEAVEVTQYPAHIEILRGRGKWDAARIAAVLLAVFSLASWGLELRLNLVSENAGPVDMMDRPPPVVSRGERSGPWQVRGEFDSVVPGGTLGNFKGTLEAGNATSRYRVGHDEFKGTILTSWWSTDVLVAPNDLSYDPDRTGAAILDSLDCTSQRDGLIYVDDANESWGNFLECGAGPTVLSSTDVTSAPTIVLHNINGQVHLVVEEDSNYPGFFYSVWTPEDAIATTGSARNVSIQHAFHIASKFRLVEAIITGIVNGVETGGGCVDLLLQHSEWNLDYALDGKERASPFGEHPANSAAVMDLSEVEPIEKGISIDSLASSCLMVLLILSAIGIVWSSCLRSRIGVDVYDRDELIRALSRSSDRTAADGSNRGNKSNESSSSNNNSSNGKPSKLSAMRMFVRRDELKNIDVIISDNDENKVWSCCSSLCFRPRVVTHDETPTLTVANESDNLRNLPPETRKYTLEVSSKASFYGGGGEWDGRGRSTFPMIYGPHSLTVSPVSSVTSTPNPASPSHGYQHSIAVAQAQMQAQAREALDTSDSDDDDDKSLPHPELRLKATESIPPADFPSLHGVTSPTRTAALPYDSKVNP